MAKVRTNFSAGRKQIDKFKDKARKELAKEAKKQVLASIAKGISPVIRQGRFKAYSTSYRNAIKAGRFREFGKKIRPVNLKLSGEMLKSIFTEVTARGVSIGFDNELAEIHNNKGAGKKKVIRRMLPTEPGETFNRNITLRFREVLLRIANKIFKK